MVQKQNLLGIMIFPLCILLTACPFSSPFKLDDEPLLPVNELLLGKWKEESPGNIIMSIEKNNEEEYGICFTGNLEQLYPFGIIHADTIKAKGFLSSVAKKQVLNLEIKGLTYLAEVYYYKDKLTLLPLNEHFTAKLIRNNASLRWAVELHLNTRLKPLYDMDFALIEMNRLP